MSAPSPIEIARSVDSSHRLLYLHIGAHKTGTTSLQKLLRRNADILASRGIAVAARSLPEKPNVEGDYVEELGRPLRRLARHKALRLGTARALRKQFAEPLTGVPDLVLSDENLLGRHLGRAVTLYPRAGRRVRNICQVFPDRSPRVILYIRNYESYIDSCFVQSLKGRRVGSFEEYISKVRLDELSWAQVAESIADAVGRENLAVRRFETIASDFGEFATEFFSLFTDPAGLDLAPIHSNPRLSGVGIEIAQAVAPLVDTEQWKKIRSFLQRSFSTRDYPGGALLSGPVARQLRARYEAEWPELLDRFPGTWLGG